MSRSHVVLLAALLATGLCLRPPITGVSPLLDQIGDDLDLSSAWLGTLSTLPVVCFGLAAFATPFWMRRIGAARVVLLCLCALALSQVVRVAGGVVVLFAGTLAAGAAIGAGNAALPALIKRWFADRIAVVTSLYTVSLVAGAAIAAGVVIPLEDGLGSDWRLPLALLAVPVALTAAGWLWVVGGAPDGRGDVAAGTLWRDRLAWQVTGFMGLQALCAYAVMVWLPTIAIDRGLSAGEGGALLALGMAFQGLGALCTPLLIRSTPDQRPALVLTVVLTAAGVVGVVFAPLVAIWPAAVVLALGQGVSFALAITLIGLRSEDSHAAGELSGMTQSVGYLIAAIGPIAIGALHDVSGGWEIPAAALLVACAAMLPVGLPAARRGSVKVSQRSD